MHRKACLFVGGMMTAAQYVLAGTLVQKKKSRKHIIFQFFRSLAQFGVGIHNILAKADAPHSQENECELDRACSSRIRNTPKPKSNQNPPSLQSRDTAGIGLDHGVVGPLLPSAVTGHQTDCIRGIFSGKSLH